MFLGGYKFCSVSISLSLSLHTGNLEPEKSKWRYYKLVILLTSVSLLSVLELGILGITPPYVAGGNGLFWGWMPIFGALKALCKNGGILQQSLF
ncbi:MAG: hypothetical protein QW279_16045 [Candidatus Jordarchaeaceae archaeon]